MSAKTTESIKKAAFINIASRYSAALVQLVYSIVLARILTPSEFGVVAIAQVFVAFFFVFSDMGLGSAIVQRQDLGNEDVANIFGSTLGLGVLLGLLFVAGGYPLSWVFENSLLVPICAGLSISVAFATCNVVPNALLLKQKRFLLMGVRQIVVSLLSSLIGVLSALLGAGCFAIVVYSVANSMLLFAWNWIPLRLLPRMRGMVSSVRKVFSYSVYLFGFNAINYFSRNLDDLVAGYFFGTVALGNYAKAYQVTRYPQMYLTSAVTPVLHPILAEWQDDPEYIYRAYLKTAKILSLLGVFISVFCFFFADQIVSIMYGDQWHEAAVFLKILSVSIWSQMVSGTGGTMFQVLNRTKEQFVSGLLIALIIVSGTLLGAFSGSAETMAVCVTIAYCCNFFIISWYLVKISFGRKVHCFLKEFIPDMAMGVVLTVFFSILGGVRFSNVATAFGVELLLGLAVFVILLVVFRQLKWIAFALPGKLVAHIPERFLA